jgi:hypothetical protein
MAYRIVILPASWPNRQRSRRVKRCDLALANCSRSFFRSESLIRQRAFSIRLSPSARFDELRPLNLLTR